MVPYRRKGEDLPPGTVGLISGSTPRFNEFFVSLERLRVPPGSTLEWAQSCNPAKNSNTCTKAMLANPQLQWIWFMGDDHTFDPLLLINLLKHDADVVVPIVTRRQPPFIPVVYKDLVFVPGDTLQMHPYSWTELALLPAGLVPIAGAGHAGMLVKRRVIEALGTDHWFRVGEVEPDELSEDLSFCDRVTQAGFVIYMDTTSTMGHLNATSYIPTRLPDGKWTIEAENGGERMRLLRPNREPVVVEKLEPTYG